MTPPDFVRDDLAKLGLVVSDHELALLARYLGAMLEANTRFNLTSIREPDDAWRRHVIDSLTLLPFLSGFGEGKSLVDVGTGGGMPGMPIAITRSDLRVTLIESTGKKARFLEETVASLGLKNVRVRPDRAEALGQLKGVRESFDVAVCRALGPMPELLEYTLPLVRVDGFVMAMKGPSVEGELKRSGDALTKLGGGEVQVYDAYPEGFGQNTVIVAIEKIGRTPRDYPRRPGVPRAEPL